VSVQDVTARWIDLCAVLQIDGLDTVWYLGSTAPDLTPIAPARGTQTAKSGLLSVGSTSASISLQEGVPDSSSVSLRMLIQPDNNARDLLRRAPFGPSARTTLEASLEGRQQLGIPLTIHAVDPIDAFPASGVIHIGQEAIAYTSKSNAARTFSCPSGGRGMLGTRIQRHIADPPRSKAPRIYGECATWKRRTARVWVGQVDSTGAWLNAPVVEAEGFISGIPQRDQQGAIEVELETLPSALDAEFGAAGVETKLQTGYHIFDGDNANRFDAFTEIWTVGAAFDAEEQVGKAAGANPLTLAVGAVPELFKSTDPEAMALLISAKPAAGIRAVGAALAGANGPDDPAGTISLTGGVPAAVVAGDRIKNARLEFVSSYEFGTPGSAAVVEWPAALDDLSAELQNAVTAATPGPWAAITIDAAGSMQAEPQWSVQTPSPLLLRWLQPSTSTCWGICPGSQLPALTEAGIEPGDWPAYDPRGRRARRDNPRPSPAQPPEVGLEAGDVAEYGLTIPDAWWQPPERYMHVADSIAAGASPASPVWILAKHQRDGAEVRSTWPVVGEVAASTITGGTPGFALEIREQDRAGVSVAQVSGDEPPVIRAAAAWRDESTSTIIRQALASLTGTGANGADDVQPYGLGVPSALIDSAAFDAMDIDPIGPRSHLFDEAEDSRDIISAFCRSIGAVLTERLNQDTGRRMLSLEPSGLPVPQQSVQTIANGDWLVTGRPVVVEDSDTLNRIAFELQWGDPLQRVSIEDEDRGTYTIGVTDTDSTSEQGGQPNSEDLPLYGIRADEDDPRLIQDLLLPLAQARFAAYGYPRKVVQGQAAYSVGVTLYPGAVVTIAADELDGYDGQPLASTTALVVSVERDVMAQACTVRAVYWPANTAGWAPALQVTSTTGYSAGVAIPVTANHYAPSASPSGAAQTDVDLFAVGDAVSFIPRGDYASKVDATVTAIGANTITLDQNVPASAGTIRPQVYASTSAVLQGYCHMADDVDLDFTNGDPAKVYS